MSSIEELIKIRKKQEKLKLKPYKEIHKQIWNEIENIVKLNIQNSMVYQVPSLLFGHTQYDVEDCCKWQINKLQTKGKSYITAYLLENNIIYIRWDFSDKK